MINELPYYIYMFATIQGCIINNLSVNLPK